MKKLSLLALLVVATLVVTAACTPTVTKLELPEGTQKLSDVIPALGEH